MYGLAYGTSYSFCCLELIPGATSKPHYRRKAALKNAILAAKDENGKGWVNFTETYINDGFGEIDSDEIEDI